MEIVKIYAIEGCPYCLDLKRMLINENIGFTYIDVNRPENELEFRSIVEKTKSDDVPIVRIGKHLLVPNTSFNSIDSCFELIKKFLEEK